MSESATPTPASNRSVMIVLSYLGLLALIPLLIEKNDHEVQWHAKHGLVLLAAEVVLFLALGVLGMVVGAIPGLGCVSAIIGMLMSGVLWLGIIVLHIMCIVKGLNGQRLIVPGVSEYANRF